MIITNDHDAKTKTLIEQYARRMTIEQRLAEIIRAFCADALSSPVNLNVDLDVMLCVLAQALLAAFRARLGSRLPRRHPRRPATPLPRHPRNNHQRPAPITVRIERRAYSPVLRQADLPADTTVPWWHGPPPLRVRLSVAVNPLRGNPR